MAADVSDDEPSSSSSSSSFATALAIAPYSFDAARASLPRLLASRRRRRRRLPPSLSRPPQSFFLDYLASAPWTRSHTYGATRIAASHAPRITMLRFSSASIALG